MIFIIGEFYKLWTHSSVDYNQTNITNISHRYILEIVRPSRTQIVNTDWHGKRNLT
jgi:hypothetical protein